MCYGFRAKAMMVCVARSASSLQNMLQRRTVGDAFSSFETFSTSPSVVRTKIDCGQSDQRERRYILCPLMVMTLVILTVDEQRGDDAETRGVA